MSFSRRKFIKTALFAGFGFAMFDAFWMEKYFIETKHFYIGSASEENHDVNIVQISDLHLRSLNTQLEKLATNINALKPDLILFTGDSVDDKKNLYVLNQFLALLNTAIKKFAILGNWEYWGKVDIEELRLSYALHNCELLINDTRQFLVNNKTISITGLDDFVAGNADIEHALMNYQASDYHIILNHCPEYGDTIFEKLNNKIPYDIMLSGHTHGGQINLFGFVPFKPQGSGNYLKGWYPLKKIYVSKGIGTSIVPARFMARSEVTVFKLLKG